MCWLIQYIPGPKSMYAIWNHGSWQFELFHWHLFTGMHGLTCHPSSLSRPLSLSSNSWKVLCTHPYKIWKLYKNESQKKIPFNFAEDKPPSGKYCPFQFIYLNRLENVQKSQNCPDNPDILWTIQKLSRQSRNSHRTIQKLFGQSRICPDNPETVRTIQKLSW